MWVSLWAYCICQTYISSIVISGIHRYEVGIVMYSIPQKSSRFHLMYSLSQAYTQGYKKAKRWDDEKHKIIEEKKKNSIVIVV